MGFCLLPEAEAELDEIWFYIARASGSMEIANRLIDSITEQLFLLGSTRKCGGGIMTCATVYAASLWANT